MLYPVRLTRIRRELVISYRILRLANITLSTEQEAAWNQSRERVSDPDFEAPWLKAEPNQGEEAARADYLVALEARERLEIVEDWLSYLLLMQAEMNAEELRLYGRRLRALLAVARGAIQREMRRAKLEIYEDHLGGGSKVGPKITLDGWQDDITRVFESAIESGLFSSKTEASQITRMFFIERPHRDLTNSYRASKSRVQGRKTESAKLVAFVKKLLEKLQPKAIEAIVEHAMALLASKDGRS
jgi:hypothetical protein